MANFTHAAVIEWGSDESEEPDLVLGPDLDSVLPRAVKRLQAFGDGAYGEEDFLDEHPYPPLDDLDAIRAWLVDLRDHTTQPWVGFYEVDENGETESIDPYREWAA